MSSLAIPDVHSSYQHSAKDHKSANKVSVSKNPNRKFGTVLSSNSTPTLSLTKPNQKSELNGKTIKNNSSTKNVSKLNVKKENGNANQCAKQNETNLAKSNKPMCIQQTNTENNSKHIRWLTEKGDAEFDDYYRTLINERLLAIMETAHENQIISQDIQNLRNEIDFFETLINYAE